MNASLYERLGGGEAVVAAVSLFYAKLLGEPTLAPFFQGLDMDALVKKQVEFLTLAFGGKDEAEVRDLREAHAALVARGLSDAEFERTGALLSEALGELGVEAALIGEVSGIVETTRERVLGRG